MINRWRSAREGSEEDTEDGARQDPRSAALDLSRRKLLQRSVAVAAVAAPAGVLVARNLGQATAAHAGAGIAAAARPSLGERASLAPLAVAQAFQQIQQHENDHVTFIKGALGSKARPKPTFKGIEQPSMAAFENTSRVLENTGVGAYLLGASIIKDKNILLKAATILTVEARHAGWINVLLNQPISPFGSFDQQLSQAEVVNRASPFIASLNGGPDPSAAPQNDNDVLNFALLLEFLEAEFYNVNVPKFFGGGTPGNG